MICLVQKVTRFKSDIKQKNIQLLSLWQYNSSFKIHILLNQDVSYQFKMCQQKRISSVVS